MALNKYLILRLALVEPDFKISKVLNIIITVCVCVCMCGVGALNGDVWVILGSN